ncbi:MAG: glycoside hydrolase family 3 C-terminal domain-containing protein [Firmicutes bacterium]|nr:glycoside hydrolase family 3 C-terminal domain-containing protein [Bacillota bacterium]
MTLEDKIALCSGADFWHTKVFEQYGIEKITMSDGPHGLRKQENASDMLGLNRSIPATCFPTASLSACSFDTALLEDVGEAIAKEAIRNDVQVVLGPGANIKRNPLCGRNFEYFSEDPYLTGELAASYIRGVEKTGIGSSLKHFALNNQEYKRFSSNSMVDERTMREIYLSGFEKAIQKGEPSTVMCSYNKINGVHASDHKELLTDILRKEWNFDGTVITDWGAMSNRILAFQAGCDLSMPGGSAFMEKECLQAVKEGRLKEEDIDASVERIIKLVQKKKPVSVEEDILEKNYILAKKVAQESVVLLKNEDILPLTNQESVLFIGEMAKNIRYQGSGSSHINPYKLSNVLDAAPNCRYIPNLEQEDWIEYVKQADTIVLFAGLTDAYESEGFDRKHMKMPEEHVQMIETVCKNHSHVVVVLMSGSVIEIPWQDHVKGILYAGLSGEAGGEAIVDILFGKINPSGRLAETWPVVYEDCITSSYYGNKHPQYREGIYVGYRYFDKVEKRVQYPFGYGLSYTHFSYRNLKVKKGNPIQVSCTITNDGNRSGKEVVQLYVHNADTMKYRAIRELKGFCKIELAPKESKEITFELTERDFSIWQQGWQVVQGNYQIEVGKSSRDIQCSQTIFMEGIEVKESPSWYTELEGIVSSEDFKIIYSKDIIEDSYKKGSFTMENSVLEMKNDSIWMRWMYTFIGIFISKGIKGPKDESNPEYNLMMTSATDCSLRSMKINAGMNNGIFEGLLELANGHFIKGILKMIKG